MPDLPRQINVLVVDSTNPQVVFAGTGSSGSGSGVYKSEDGGSTWQLTVNGLPSEDVASLALSQASPPTLYAAASDNVFASTDGGANWMQRAAGVGNGRGFSQMRVAPGNGDILYAVTVIEGAFRSDDGGYNWMAINNGLPKDDNGSLNVQAVAIDPGDPYLVYVGTGWESSSGNGVFKSTDGGATWTPANRGMIDYSIHAIAVDPHNPRVLYAGAYGGDLFKSADGGETWMDITGRLPDKATVVDIVVDPTTPDTVYLLFDRLGVLVSTNGGERWRLAGRPGELEYPTPTALAVVSGPQPAFIIGVRDSGGWRYAAGEPAPSPRPTEPSSGSQTAAPTLVPGRWQQTSDLPQQVNALVVDPADPQVFYAGTGSSGSGSGVYKSQDAGQTWRLVSDGLPGEDVAALAFSQDDPPVLYAAVRSSLFASTDGGANWIQQAAQVGNGRGFSRMRVAPGNGNALYAVAVIEGTFHSEDGGYNWMAINNGLPEDSNGSVNVQALAIDPADADVLYAGTGWGASSGNGVFKSTDGGQTWAPANRGMIDYGITALAINPTDSQVVYAGADRGELFKSTDGGETWTDLTSNLPEQTRVVEIVVDPAAPERIYLLCERVGVLVSGDGGTRWQLLGKPANLDYPMFTAMAVASGPQPVVVVGIREEGGWWYTGD